MSVFRVIVNLFQFNKTNWKAVSLCMAAAAIFWLFNALNKNYQTNLRFPVEFHYDQDRFIPVKPLPESVFMNVSGNGWDLLRKTLGFQLPALALSLDRPTEVKKVVGSTLPALLAGQLGSLEVNYVVTDTLYLDFDPVDEHRFKLVVDASGITFDKSFGRLSPIVVLPDSIRLRGPKSIIHALPDSIVITLKPEQINDNYRREVEIDVPHGELINRTPPIAEVMFEVGEFVEVDHYLKLSVVRKEGGPRLNLVRDSVRCRVLLPAGHVAEFVAQESVQALLDVSNIKKGETKLLPSVVGLPPHARLTAIDSVSVRLY